MSAPCVFLDRDDTINRNADLPEAAWDGVKRGDLLKPEFALLVPGAKDALIALKNAGYTLVVITNQGGLARAGGTTRDVEAVNDALRKLLNAPSSSGPLFGDQLIDAWYYAPHHPDGSVGHYCEDHAWRKPQGGMVRAACEELDLDPSRSWMVGDKQRDLDAAIDAGLDASRTVQVGPDGSVPDLTAAAARILAPQPGSNAEPIDHPVPSKAVQASRVTLRAPDPAFVPMRDERTRAMVEAIARGIAERTGIVLHELQCSESQVSAVVETHRLGALAFMSELRRDTNRWHERQFGVSLWNPEGLR